VARPHAGKGGEKKRGVLHNGYIKSLKQRGGKGSIRKRLKRKKKRERGERRGNCPPVNVVTGGRIEKRKPVSLFFT